MPHYGRAHVGGCVEAYQSSKMTQEAIIMVKSDPATLTISMRGKL